MNQSHEPIFFFKLSTPRVILVLFFFLEFHGRTTTQTTLWCAWWCAKHRRANICRTQASATPNELHYANVKRGVAEVTSFLERLRRYQKITNATSAGAPAISVQKTTARMCRGRLFVRLRTRKPRRSLP